MRVGQLAPPDQAEDAPEQRVTDVRQVEVVVLDAGGGRAHKFGLGRRTVSCAGPGRFPLLSRGRHEAVDDAIVVEAALMIF